MRGRGCLRPFPLTKVFGQAARSPVVNNAHEIEGGAIPDRSRPEGDSDFYFVVVQIPYVVRGQLDAEVSAHRFSGGQKSGDSGPGGSRLL